MSVFILKMPVDFGPQRDDARCESAESFDTYELVDHAAEALEGYRRAPWRQLSKRLRMAKLREAIELLQRAEGVETGQIPSPIWGD